MRKTKLHLFTIADYEDEERWLRQQHRQGLRLVKTILPFFYIFEACTPEDVVYRLDYRNGSADSEYLQMFQDYGWEYFNCCTGWLYFRKPASEIQSDNDGEIFSDNESKLDMIHHVIKTRMLPVLVIFLFCLLPNWPRSFPGTSSPLDIFFSILFVSLTVLYIVLIAYCGGKLRKLRAKYKNQ